MKVLNLYAGIGGNRKLWTDVEVTVVELNPKIAGIYKDFFPDDNVVVGDAHQYLLEHFKEYDFIWASPPCPTHSRFNTLNVGAGMPPKYPNMKLYEEIILLKHWFKGKYCIENVISYYKPLIRPTESNNHYFWTNFHIKPLKNTTRGIRKDSDMEYIRKINGFNLQKYSLKEKDERQMLNNCVEPYIGLHILNESKIDLQPELFRKV